VHKKAVSLAVFAFGVLFAGQSLAATDKAELLRQEAKNWNVVIALIDAAVADHMSVYGYHKKTTPNLERLAKETVVFENAFAPAPYTISSMGSFFTGLYPHHHGSNDLGPKLGADVVTLGQVVKTAGLPTFGFTGNRLGGSLGGYDKGFDRFVEFQGLKLTTSDKCQPMILNWLDSERPSGRFFLFVHYVPPHTPYDPPAPFKGTFSTGYTGPIDPNGPNVLGDIDHGKLKVSPADLQHIADCYDDNMLYADYLVGQLMDKLRQLKLWDNTLFILIADHGEAFGEHGRMLHNSTVYDEMSHVPLMVHFPTKLVKPRRTSALICSAADMLPTLADVLRVSDAPRNIDGLSWLPVIVGKVKEIRSDVLLRSISNKPTWALRTKQFKYLYEAETGGRELYDMRADPKEKKNILADKPDVAQKMHKRMEELVGTSLPITEPPK